MIKAEEYYQALLDKKSEYEGAVRNNFDLLLNKLLKQ